MKKKIYSNGKNKKGNDDLHFDASFFFPNSVYNIASVHLLVFHR